MSQHINALTRIPDSHSVSSGIRNVPRQATHTFSRDQSNNQPTASYATETNNRRTNNLNDGIEDQPAWMSQQSTVMSHVTLIQSTSIMECLNGCDKLSLSQCEDVHFFLNTNTTISFIGQKSSRANKR